MTAHRPHHFVPSCPCVCTRSWHACKCSLNEIEHLAINVVFVFNVLAAAAAAAAVVVVVVIIIIRCCHRHKLIKKH